mmetsp:Transcript_14632/g.22565  ORF Transcript_14632/g.22565 Transcript_14632/m.22565 type:complete len:87 (-) Transcript_14632:28-288(-)
MVFIKDENEEGGGIGWDDTGTYEKRITTLESFQTLKNVGIEVYENEFAILDMSDIRIIPRYNRRGFGVPGAQSDQESESGENDDAS